MMRLCIAGSRTIIAFDRFEKAMDWFLKDHPIDLWTTTIVEGCAFGIDRSAERWALARGMKLDHYPAKYYNSPLIRNQAMLQTSDMLVAFWDGQSRGTKYSIEYGHKLGLPVYVYRMKPDVGLPGQTRLERATESPPIILTDVVAKGYPTRRGNLRKPTI